MVVFSNSAILCVFSCSFVQGEYWSTIGSRHDFGLPLDTEGEAKLCTATVSGVRLEVARDALPRIGW